jgi:hypothetical protein
VWSIPWRVRLIHLLENTSARTRNPRNVGSKEQEPANVPQPYCNPAGTS